ncbi:ATP synthase mitochondrial F1 complex assembly factor 1-like [Diadema setosum]|uniref:ATP synthase mitochondrial F1 complex assembly factor 1-like n=1 Tax=Diadema setosum TaxID=31175 RepID=UPI003B3A4F72
MVSGAQDDESSIEKNAFYAKYADKIKKLQSSEPEVFQSRLDMVKEAKKKTTASSTQSAKQSLSDTPRPPQMKPGESQGQKSLDSIVKTDLLRQHSVEEITQIWKDFHKDKDYICAVIPSDTYSRMQEKAREFPMFLYPLPRAEGYEFFFAQFDNHCCYFTSVINYQAYQENAPALLTITHYPELQEEKGIVLMRGEMDTKFVSVQDAQFFANQLQLYYATEDAARQQLLSDFNRRPADFKHMNLIAQLSNTAVGLG